MDRWEGWLTLKMMRWIACLPCWRNEAVFCKRDSKRVANKKRLSKLDEARNSGLDEDELQENVGRVEEVWVLWRWGGFWTDE
jgi:hypothetical protein